MGGLKLNEGLGGHGTNSGGAISNVCLKVVRKLPLGGVVNSISGISGCTSDSSLCHVCCDLKAGCK